MPVSFTELEPKQRKWGRVEGRYLPILTDGLCTEYSFKAHPGCSSLPLTIPSCLKVSHRSKVRVFSVLGSPRRSMCPALVICAHFSILQCSEGSEKPRFLRYRCSQPLPPRHSGLRIAGPTLTDSLRICR